MNDVQKAAFSIGVIPVIAIDDAEKAVPLARALLAGGLPAAEVTFRTAAGEEAIRRIAAEVPEVLVGAGTVLNLEQCDRALAAGAKFIVSPGYNEALVAHCQEKGVLVLPGCVNASDMTRAANAGLEYVKFFPAEQSGGVNGVMINKDAWNQLPEEYQNAIQMAAEICTSEQLSRYLWMDFDSTKKMLEEDGCVVTKMNQDDWNTIRETCRQVYEEEAAKNENFNMVYSSMQDYREHADTYRAMLGDYGWGFNYDESEK